MALDVSKLIRAALAEDLGGQGDVTTAALVPPDAVVTAYFVTRRAGLVAGLEIIGQVFDVLSAVIPAQAGGRVEIHYHAKDGDFVVPQTRLATVTGSAAAILTAERTALNFITHLSGIATATHTLQQKIAHTKAKVCDTRKTTPGLRELEKYAVRCGGGANHRMGLFDMVMIKDNHIAVLGGNITAAIAKARAAQPGLTIAVEVESLDQLRTALSARADRIMLDNMPVPIMREAVEITANQAILEATGGVNADNIAAIAETGVDFISVGAITHSAPALDIGLDFAENI